eukprot:TRINITY_DN11325_c0_g1_i1.p3 TRINITY_DN11325_c0_g1~~TRINITY_DN11325_c0_g1_i1.p3  ORF type:complete len:56 (-),score=3.31 TRINITY_DN11325_c0_g1_i1:211-378(-)
MPTCSVYCHVYAKDSIHTEIELYFRVAYMSLNMDYSKEKRGPSYVDLIHIQSGMF